MLKKIEPIQELTCIRRTVAAMLEYNDLSATPLFFDQWEFNLALPMDQSRFPRIFFESGKYTILHDLRLIYGIPACEITRGDIQRIIKGLEEGKIYILSINPYALYDWYSKIADLELSFHTISLIMIKDNKLLYWDSRSDSNECYYNWIEKDKLFEILTTDVWWELDFNRKTPKLPIEVITKKQMERLIFRMEDTRCIKLGHEEISYGINGFRLMEERVNSSIHSLDDKLIWRKTIYGLTRCLDQREILLKTLKEVITLDEQLYHEYIAKWRYFRLAVGKKDANKMRDYLHKIYNLELDLYREIKKYLDSLQGEENDY